MRLIEALCAGIRGAENGTAEIYVRGTSTFAQVYADFDGSGTQTPSSGLALDSNGGAVWFVNQPVTIKAKDSLGNVVRQFTVFDAATDVEVRSASFTGTDYTTGASAAGNPQLLSTVLDLWKTSAGAVDFNVLTGGASRTLQAALSAQSGLFFNVKDPAYGATGNGVTDDRAAIQAAITAANAVAGWVFFPPGSFLVGTPGLTVAGCAGFIGPGGAKIASSAAGMTQLTINGVPANTGKFQIIGLAFTVTGVGSKWISMQAGDLLLLSDRLVLSGTFPAGTNCVIAVAGTGDAVTIIDSNLTFDCPAAFQAFSLLTVAALYAEFNGTAITGGQDMILCTDGIFAGCDFATTTSMQSYIRQSTAAQAIAAIGCDFASPSSGNVNEAILSSNGGALVFEAGNSFGANVTLPVFYSALADASTGWGESRSTEQREAFAASDAATINFTNAFGACRVVRTTATGQTLNLPAPLFPGQMFSLTIINNSAGAPLEQLVTIKGLPTVTPGAGTKQTVVARGVLVSGTLNWVLVSNTNWT